MNIGYFPPQKRRGIIMHSVILLALLSISIIGFIILSRSQVGPAFLTALLIAIGTFILIPFFGYRLYALMRANYKLDRDSFSIHWGLRVEDIPLSDIEWMRPAGDLTNPLILPAFRLPGSIVGVRRHPDLGVVEFMASEEKDLLLVATAKRVYVISPKDANALTQTFARATELGSLSPVTGKSEFPSFVIAQAWEAPLTRFLWLGALFLNIGMLVWAALIIPSLKSISLGFNATGAPLANAPAVQLILLPITSLLLSVTGWSAGLYFYRWEKERALAYIVWASNMASCFLFLIGMIFSINL